MNNYCEYCGGRFTTQPGVIEKLCECNLSRTESEDNVETNTIPPTAREQLADYAHDAWIDWMKYMFEIAIQYKPGKVQAEKGALIIPKWAVDRWLGQMNKPYNKLPEKMKESDREQADKILEITRKEEEEKDG